MSEIVLKSVRFVEGRLNVEVEPVSIGTGRDAATVLTKLIGLPTTDDDEVFDLFQVDQDGDPSGDTIGQMRWSGVGT